MSLIRFLPLADAHPNLNLHALAEKSTIQSSFSSFDVVLCKTLTNLRIASKFCCKMSTSYVKQIEKLTTSLLFLRNSAYVTNSLSIASFVLPSQRNEIVSSGRDMRMAPKLRDLRGLGYNGDSGTLHCSRAIGELTVVNVTLNRVFHREDSNSTIAKYRCFPVCSNRFG